MTKFAQDIRAQVDTLKREIVKPCKICHGSGKITDAKDDHYCSNCKCFIIFRYLSRLAKAMIPMEYWALDGETLHFNDEIKSKMFKFIDHLDKAQKNGLGLILQGSNGVGKTSMACTIGKAAISQGFSVRYFTLASYVDAVFAKADGQDKIDYFEEGQILIIDEIDKCSAKIKTMLDAFFRRMFNMRKVVICATNSNKDELENLLGKPILSLLKRHCMYVEFEGDDYSTMLESDFDERLLFDVDYYDPVIWKQAYEFERRSVEGSV